jgi:hypothetical protein
MINTSVPIFVELVDRLQLSLFTFSITKLSLKFTSGNITRACLFGIVHIGGCVSNARRTRLKVCHFEAMGMLKRNMQQIYIDEDWVVQNTRSWSSPKIETQLNWQMTSWCNGWRQSSMQMILR